MKTNLSHVRQVNWCRKLFVILHANVRPLSAGNTFDGDIVLYGHELLIVVHGRSEQISIKRFQRSLHRQYLFPKMLPLTRLHHENIPI